MLRGIIFNSTTIPVQVLLISYHNNNTVHTTTDTDTDKDTVLVPYMLVPDKDTDTCNFDAELNAHVFYRYLEDVGIQVSKCGHSFNKFYAFLNMYFIKYYNTLIQIYVLLVIYAVKYHNRYNYNVSL